MRTEQFMKLVEKYDGFQFVPAYRDDEDHFIGGKGNNYWYFINKNGKTKELYLGIYADGQWQDRCIKGSGKKKTEKEMPPGSTIKRIAEEAYLHQDEEWVKKKKNPKVIQDSHPHYHYVLGFGDKALDVSEQYGVTIAYSDLKDLSAGFHLRYLHTGADVDVPEG
ncbi:MAG: hypothetical protein K5989_06790 [Lachnospiraceae bacterium]|nr:hypothetical protein [Lachnospiraceae bacterium]